MPEMRATDRTVTVLRALNEHNGAHVSALSAATGISRPALYRILNTLAAMGYVRRRADGDAFELTMLVRALSDGYKDEDWLRHAAIPVMEALQQEVVWPTDLATFRDNAMYLRETTRRLSPMTIDGVAVGVRLPMLRTATGRAYLAFCGAAERELILDNLRASALPEDTSAQDRRLVAAMLSATRKRGYGERQEDLFPKTSALAIPVLQGERILACLSITFIASVMTPKEAARRYLTAMRQAAAAVEQGLRSLTPAGTDPPASPAAVTPPASQASRTSATGLLPKSSRAR